MGKVTLVTGPTPGTGFRGFVADARNQPQRLTPCLAGAPSPTLSSSTRKSIRNPFIASSSDDLSGQAVRISWCGRKTKIRANGTATAHKVRGAGCLGSGRAVNLIASCGCGDGELVGVFAYPPGRPHRKALVSAAVCERADHQDAMRQWTADMAGIPEIGFAPDLASRRSAP